MRAKSIAWQNGIIKDSNRFSVSRPDPVHDGKEPGPGRGQRHLQPDHGHALGHSRPTRISEGKQSMQHVFGLFAPCSSCNSHISALMIGENDNSNFLSKDILVKVFFKHIISQLFCLDKSLLYLGEWCRRTIKLSYLTKNKTYFFGIRGCFKFDKMAVFFKVVSNLKRWPFSA